MDRCRPAVPVWILPIYRIAEQLRVHENMFDVVIVDEASQAGLEATFLQYLAPKLVIIGDDKQVSPAAVGVDQQQLRDLANQYLYDDRYIASWQDPKRSLFDDANMRFGNKLTLSNTGDASLKSSGSLTESLTSPTTSGCCRFDSTAPSALTPSRQCTSWMGTSAARQAIRQTRRKSTPSSSNSRSASPTLVTTA